jgi:hypothetical protein
MVVKGLQALKAIPEPKVLKVYKEYREFKVIQAFKVLTVPMLYGTLLERTVAVLRMLSETLPHMMARLGIGLTLTAGMLGIRHRRERSGRCWQVSERLALRG